MSSLRVFLVTGSNKGIGKSIVKLLLENEEKKIVYLTSRNRQLGEEAVKEFNSPNLRYHQLDITDQQSIDCLRDHLVSQYGGLDVLVNNAGMAYKGSSTAQFSEQAEVTVKTNFFGTLALCDALFPILKVNARVVHVSSMASEFAFRKLSDQRKSQFQDENLTITGLKQLLQEFINDAHNGKVADNGWPESAYGMSKVGVSMMTILQQKDFNKQPDRNIVVNSCCPGLVATDMTGGKYANMKTPDEGADTPTFLALLPIGSKVSKGCFYKLRKQVPFPPTE